MLFRKLIGENTSKIILRFLSDEKSLFHINLLAKKAKVPVATTFRTVKKLLDLEIIEVTKVGKLKLYKLRKSRDTKELYRLFIKNEKKR